MLIGNRRDRMKSQFDQEGFRSTPIGALPRFPINPFVTGRRNAFRLKCAWLANARFGSGVYPLKIGWPVNSQRQFPFNAANPVGAVGLAVYMPLNDGSVFVTPPTLVLQSGLTALPVTNCVTPA